MEPRQSSVNAIAEAIEMLAVATDVLQRVPELVSAALDSQVPDVLGVLLRVRAQCEGSAVAVLHEAEARGVVRASDAAGPAQWMVHAATAAGVPITGREAAQFRAVAAECAAPDAGPLREAVHGGRIRVNEAAAVAREFRALRHEVEPESADAALCTLIEGCRHGAGTRAVAEARDRIICTHGRPDAPERRARAQYERRHLGGFHRDSAGMYIATLTLDPHSHAVIEAALSALARPVRDEDGLLDGRLPGQRRVDALRELCARVATTAGNLPEIRPSRAQVVLTMAYADLADGVGVGVTGHEQPLPAATVRRLACDAGMIPAVLGADSALLDLGRTVRFASPAQVAAVRLRDRGCSFPGCDRPPGWCDVHHVIHWISGGPTDLGNLAALCEAHHTLVHQRGYTATITPTSVTWHREPAGTPPNAPPRAPPCPPPHDRPRRPAA